MGLCHGELIVKAVNFASAIKGAYSWGTFISWMEGIISTVYGILLSKIMLTEKHTI